MKPIAHRVDLLCRGGRPLPSMGVVAAVLSLCAPALLEAPPARAACGATSCFLVTETTETPVPEGSVRIDLSLHFIPQDRRLEGSDEVREVLVPKIDFESGDIEPDHHREIRTQNTMAQLDLAYGVSPRWTLFANLPLLVDRDHEHYDEVGEPTEFFTGEDGASGFGDVRVGARTSFLARQKDTLSGTLALEAPTGAYRLRDTEGDVNEPSLQPGSGSWDWIASAHYVHDWVPRRSGYFASLSHRRNGENDLGYRLGEETLAAFGVHARAGQRALWMLQLNARWAGRDRFEEEDVPSTGATFVNLTPGLRLESARGTSLYLHVPIPVYQDVNEAQLAPGIGLVIGVSHAF
jgi:hypothetical protein